MTARVGLSWLSEDVCRHFTFDDACCQIAVMTKLKATKAAESASEGRVYGGRNLDERRALRRQQFLDAGLAVFGSVGFRAATVRSLCREAKLTDRYFYENFSSLEELLTAVYELHMSRIRNDVANCIVDCCPDATPEQLVRDMLNIFFTALEDPRVARVCMVELEGISPEVEQLYHGYIMSFAELMISLAQQVHPHWRLPEDEAIILGMSVVGAMRQSGTHWLRSGYRIPRETVVKAALRLLMGLINNIDTEMSAEGSSAGADKK